VAVSSSTAALGDEGRTKLRFQQMLKLRLNPKLIELARLAT
jgi:hypothetical protein